MEGGIERGVHRSVIAVGETVPEIVAEDDAAPFEPTEGAREGLRVGPELPADPVEGGTTGSPTQQTDDLFVQSAVGPRSRRRGVPISHGQQTVGGSIERWLPRRP